MSCRTKERRKAGRSTWKERSFEKSEIDGQARFLDDTQKWKCERKEKITLTISLQNCLNWIYKYNSAISEIILLIRRDEIHEENCWSYTLGPKKEMKKF
jgi:hypothetical protein